MKFIYYFFFLLSINILSFETELVCEIDFEGNQKCLDKNGSEVNIALIDSDPSLLGNSYSVSMTIKDENSNPLTEYFITHQNKETFAVVKKDGSIFEGNFSLFGNETPKFIGPITIKMIHGTYFGDVDQDLLKTGLGKIEYKDGGIFQGTFLKDFPIKGNFRQVSGDYYNGGFSGTGYEYSGYGEYFFENGIFYKGNFSAGTYNGFGEMSFLNGDKYNGTWKNGLKHGLGTYTYSKPTGSVKYSISTYTDGLQDGVGVLLTKDNIPVYIGNFAKGKETGKGAQFLNINDPDGESPVMFRGRFLDGLSVGETELITNSTIFNGYWNDGANGYGITRDLNTDSTYSGIHKNDLLEGQGLYKSNVYTYKGNFKQGAFHGEGLITFNDGESVSGRFDNGEYVGNIKIPELGELAQRRIALVIGNNNYLSRPLANAVNDSAGIRDILTNLGFEVIYKSNTTQEDFLEALFEFGKRISAMGPNTTSLFYYAGHAVQVDGMNYLNPIDTEIRNRSDLDIKSINAGRIIAEMELNKTGTKIIILDACRNNPFIAFKRSALKGLAQMNASTGTIISYATAPGKEALDTSNDNGNSFYTGSLIKAMNIPGLTIEQVFKQTRRDVVRLTNGEQTPWESSSLLGDFYFVKNN